MSYHLRLARATSRSISPARSRCSGLVLVRKFPQATVNARIAISKLAAVPDAQSCIAMGTVTRHSHGVHSITRVGDHRADQSVPELTRSTGI